jgi:hypothetical protein
MILFLDFDGVLHTDPCYSEARLFEHAPRLAAAIESFPELSIVLSTAWRQQHPLHALIAPLPLAVRERVVGVTPDFSLAGTPPALIPYRRQAECHCWLHENGQADAQWLAIDDRPSLFVPYCEQLIVCESHLGLTEAVATRLHNALRRARARITRQVDASI